jgi:murein DD-endopeptidase MepM/ murein hydrolase activator NlpD
VIRLAASVAALGGVVLTLGTAARSPVTGSRTEPAVPPTVAHYVAPLPGRLEVLRGFDPPPDKYGAGHLGVDLRAYPGQPVGAAAAGTVQFAGQVAGRGVVVIAHPDGIRTEYEPVQPSVHPGEHVAAGQLIAALRGQHTGCPVRCLHWGARRGDAYLDPSALLRPLGPVVLLPDLQCGQARGCARW